MTPTNTPFDAQVEQEAREYTNAYYNELNYPISNHIARKGFIAGAKSKAVQDKIAELEKQIQELEEFIDELEQPPKPLTP